MIPPPLTFRIDPHHEFNEWISPCVREGDTILYASRIRKI